MNTNLDIDTKEIIIKILKRIKFNMLILINKHINKQLAGLTVIRIKRISTPFFG